jgi:hypothetical protein
MPSSSQRTRSKAGAARGIRTPDPVITNDVLYQLSYCGGPCGASAKVAETLAHLISGTAPVCKNREPGKARKAGGFGRKTCRIGPAPRSPAPARQEPAPAASLAPCGVGGEIVARRGFVVDAGIVGRAHDGNDRRHRGYTACGEILP